MKRKTVIAFVAALFAVLAGFSTSAPAQASYNEDPDRIVVSYSSQSGAFVTASYMMTNGYVYKRTIGEGQSSHAYWPDFFYGFTVPNYWVCISKPYGHHYGPGFYPATWIRGLFVVECFRQADYA